MKRKVVGVRVARKKHTVKDGERSVVEAMMQEPMWKVWPEEEPKEGEWILVECSFNKYVIGTYHTRLGCACWIEFQGEIGKTELRFSGNVNWYPVPAPGKQVHAL